MKTVRCKYCDKDFETDAPRRNQCYKCDMVVIKCMFCEVEFETKRKTHYLMPKFCKECAEARVWANRISSRNRAKEVGKDLKKFLAEYFDY
jgi:hypothetical protein